MPELTLESLARRLEVVERRLDERQTPRQDWRSVVGISEDNEFTRRVLAEMAAAHEAERQAALAEEEASAVDPESLADAEAERNGARDMNGGEPAESAEAGAADDRRDATPNPDVPGGSGGTST